MRWIRSNPAGLKSDAVKPDSLSMEYKDYVLYVERLRDRADGRWCWMVEVYDDVAGDERAIASGVASSKEDAKKLAMLAARRLAYPRLSLVAA